MGTLVFDGDCSFCSSTARLARRLLPRGHAVVAYQRADLPALGLTERDGADALWWVDDDGRRHRGHEAVARALLEAAGPWRLAGRLLASAALRPLGARAYEWVARNRHRLPGGRPECGVGATTGR